MLKKKVIGYGQSLVIACDGRCNKAWGINQRPSRYYMEKGQPPRELRADEDPVDDDDYVWKSDDELGEAPVDPGTYEGGCGKPSGKPLTDPEQMNKWCFRECERCESFKPGEPIVLRKFKNPRPNITR